MNKYEIMMILKPDLEDDAKTALLDGFKAILTEGEGVVDNVDTEKLGLRELAYEIKDYTKGLYVVIDTPDCEEYDTSWSAQMVAADIMHKLVPYLGIPADNPDYERDVYIDAKTLKPVVKRPSSVDVDEVKPDGGANLPDEEESASKEDGQEEESSENKKPDENESPPE